ncbi:MAG: hypothetical protein IJB33_01120 [Akkermansia sp.]|nr:hypothetical protein [Akkermansia sp.]
MSFRLYCAVLDFGLPHQGMGTMPLLTTCFRAFSPVTLSGLSRFSPNMIMLLSSRAVCIYLMDS